MAVAFKSFGGLLDEMYFYSLSPSPKSFEAVAEACASAGAWDWVLQLYEESQLNNLPVTSRMMTLQQQAELLDMESPPKVLG